MYNHDDDELAKIPVTDLVEPWILLRPIRRTSVDYLELKDDIDRKGLIHPIAVRPSLRHPGKWEVICGNWRFAACVELGWHHVLCVIKHGVSDNEVLEWQVAENAIRPTTLPLEFSRQLKRIFDLNPDMTIAELSRAVGKNAQWIKDRLNLLDLAKPLQVMVDRGEIPLVSAYMLAKINPKRVRPHYAELAKIMPVMEFKALAAGVIKQFAECVHQGKMDIRYLPKFEAQPHIRDMATLKAEIANSKEGALVLVAEGCKNMTDAWTAALKWVLHMDRESVSKAEEIANITNWKQLESEAHDETPLG